MMKIDFHIWKRIFRNIHGPSRTEYEDWRRKTNYELEKLTNRGNIGRFIKAQTLGHILGVPDERVVKIITDWEPPEKTTKWKTRK